jgi:hypothetical protein
MKEFDSFLAKVLAPIRDESQPAPPGQEQTPPEAVPAGELERRYVEVMNALLADATGRSAVNVFTDVAAWKLATVAYRFGPLVASDILRKLGAHLGKIAEAEDAQREANEAAKEGRLPN